LLYLDTSLRDISALNAAQSADYERRFERMKLSNSIQTNAYRQKGVLVRISDANPQNSAVLWREWDLLRDATAQSLVSLRASQGDDASVRERVDRLDSAVRSWLVFADEQVVPL